MEAERWRVWKETYEGKKDGGGGGQVTPKDILKQKTQMMTTLSMAGKSNDEIKAFMRDYDEALLSIPGNSNQYAALYSFNRWQQGGGSPQRNDVLEAIRLGAELKGQPQQNDLAAVITALGGIMKGREEKDPVESLNSAVALLSPFMQSQSTAAQLAHQQTIDFMKMQMDQNKAPEWTKNPVEMLKTMRDLQMDLGGGGNDESDEIKKLRIQADREDNQRAYEQAKVKWEKEWEGKQEVQKQKAQSELLGGIMGTVTKAFESPVIRELGKNVGSRFGVKENPISAAQTRAAQSELSNPTDIPFQFQCPTCNTTTKFTAKELTLIREKGGKWACPKCASPFELGKA